MTSEEETGLNPTQQVVAGFAIGVSGIIVCYFAGAFVLRTVLTMTPKMAAKHIAGAVVTDIAIGTIPVLQTGTAITIKAVAVSIAVTALWMIGGVPALQDPVFDLLKIPHSPLKVPDFVFDQPLSQHSEFVALRSRGGTIQAITYNPARIDP